MKKKVIAHIGLPKTGTTFIQQMFSSNPCFIYGEECDFFLDNILSLKGANPPFSTLNDGCNIIFFSNEEPIFSGLRPAIDRHGNIFLREWQVNLVKFLGRLKKAFPKEEMEIIYSTRKFEEWLISSYTQNYDSYYWVQGISYASFKSAIVNKAPEIVDLMKDSDVPKFESVLSSYGTPKKMQTDAICNYLKNLGMMPIYSIDENIHNNRSFSLCGQKIWMSNPITIGQVIAKILRNSDLPIYRLVNRVLSSYPFRVISLGFFLLNSDGNAKFKFHIQVLKKLYNYQQVGLILDNQKKTLQI